MNTARQSQPLTPILVSEIICNSKTPHLLLLMVQSRLTMTESRALGLSLNLNSVGQMLWSRRVCCRSLAQENETVFARTHKVCPHYDSLFPVFQLVLFSDYMTVALAEQLQITQNYCFRFIYDVRRDVHLALFFIRPNIPIEAKTRSIKMFSMLFTTQNESLPRR